ncbi:Protein smf [Actinoplanes sp. SE50]|uniref:DNA processing protein DprA n=1 Tax=unclassified Actinoplanes TaxID=2626549 RepID=UPI00023ED234|nr:MULTISPECIES: DNA processing protein DprA [unclassified Actinoplanes]AEV84410.1 Protein smf [Actinoplanes sp. SE50/110]ATO82802.1 Protein smf [Actinoplanes sp. SE50]SLM00210.1 DNA processing protein DprA [Actinoplanes sp. SE50/110]
MNPYDEIRTAYITLGWLFEPGNPPLTRRVIADGPDEVVAALLDEPLIPAMLRRELRGQPDHQLWAQARHTAQDSHIITPSDSTWPCGFDPDGPLCLWSHGTGEPPYAAEAITIVGSRACTAYGSHVATDLAGGLAERDWTIVTDGGYGIATSAMLGALRTSRPPIAVLPGGLDHLHPTGNRQLLELVGDTGLLLSPYPPGAEPVRDRVLYVKRLLADLSTATVLVEAPPRSAALHAVRRALHLGRHGLIVPGPVTSVHSGGGLDVLRTDSRARPVGSVADILTDLT